ncbi:galactosamine-6-phosphate isomerase [Spirosomataceae bacterium TFI 002]|nr:galactosamine-6-phosphate isomerase [Spirosomataceae bacterium TFI 002]
MDIKVFDDAERLATAVADHIINLVKSKPTATLVLTSGDTPKRAYQIIAQKAKVLDFSQCMIIGLDEWVGIGPENEGSCSYIVIENLLKPLGISVENYTFFDALGSNLEQECLRVDKLISDRGGLDYILVGLGLNGHIGLNEPGYSFDHYCHVSDLAQMTIEVGQKYFNSATTLSKGITIGLKHLLEAQEAMLMVSGSKKASIVAETINKTPSSDVPSTVFQLHKNASLFLDKEAASNI